MYRFKETLAAVSLSSVLLLMPNAHAGSLLGIIGTGANDDSLITLNSGPASNNGTVNIGLGGGGGNVADVNVGTGGYSAASANVSLGGGSGSNSGGGLSVNLGVGPADVNLNLLGGGNGGGGSGGGDGGGNGPGTGGPGAFASGGGNGSQSGSSQVNCVGEDPNNVLRLFNATQINLASWARASDVTIVPVRLCPPDRVQVAELINSTGKGMQMQAAVASDALIATSLTRSRYDASRVAAVQRRGPQVLVYVY